MSANIQAAYNWAVETCNNPNVGYSMTYRNQQTVNGITYYDCSSFIWFALKAGGFDVVAAHGGQEWPFTTYDMTSVLDTLGFDRVPVNSEWKPGDILIRNNSYGHHTEMVYSGRRTMGAHGSRYPLADQVSIYSGDSNPSTWDTCHRYGGGASGKGVSPYVVAAICGNWMRESTLNPGQWEIGYKQGFGLGQWTDNSETDRRTRLLNWLSQKGYATNDGDGQLEYLIAENVWYKTGDAAQFKDLQAFLNSDSTDIDMLTSAFLTGWEGMPGDHLEERINYAKGYYQYISEHYEDTPKAWYNKEDYNNPASTIMAYGSEANYNNALLIYKHLSGVIPGPGPSPGGDRDFLIAILAKKKRRDSKRV